MSKKILCIENVIIDKRYLQIVERYGLISIDILDTSEEFIYGLIDEADIYYYSMFQQPFDLVGVEYEIKNSCDGVDTYTRLRNMFLTIFTYCDYVDYANLETLIQKLKSLLKKTKQNKQKNLKLLNTVSQKIEEKAEVRYAERGLEDIAKLIKKGSKKK